MNDITIENIKILHNQTGCSMNMCKTALEKCSCIESAKEYLIIKGTAVMRYHIEKDKDGQIIKRPFSDKDFIQLAQDLVKENKNGL